MKMCENVKQLFSVTTKKPDVLPEIFLKIKKQKDPASLPIIKFGKAKKNCLFLK